MTVLYHTHITQGLASPANWSSGDLVDLGDLLVVLTPDDFKQVSVPGTGYPYILFFVGPKCCVVT